MSIFYSKQRLASAELYLPKVDRAPKLEPQDAHFRLVPGEIEVGMQFTSLPEHFGPMKGMPTRIGPYEAMFEARFPGGAAYAMGNDGTIERLGTLHPAGMTPRIICAALAAILIAVALLALRPPERAGGSLRDFQVYRAAGAVAADRGVSVFCGGRAL